jgi:hypothetical protein
VSTRALRPLCIAIVLALAAMVLPALLSTSAQASPTAASSTGAARVFDRLPGFRIDRSRPVTVAPREFSAFRLDAAQARSALAPALADNGGAPVRIAVPAPDGSSQVFSVVEDSVMEPALAAQHPEIRTFAGRGVTDPTSSIRLDQSPLGFHAAVRGPLGVRAWYVDPAYRGRGVTAHLSYHGSAVPRAAEAFVERDLADTEAIIDAAPAVAARGGEAVKRRVYRLALVTDPSYAAYFGTANVLAAKTTLVNRVNQVYNDDLAIRFVLIAGTDLLNLDTAAKASGANGPCGLNACYDAADLAPETGGCSSALLTRTEFVLGQLVGADSYDLGHIGLGINGGGIAGLGVVGGSSKASGCTGLPFPKGDFYAVDYVAHEIGHQMGGNHTFDGTLVNCSLTNRNATTSVEPGSGSSVMAYAGICGQDNLQPHSDPYFSQRSIDEITATVTAEPAAVDEVQTVSFGGFDDAADSVTLGFDGRTTTIANDSSYNLVQLQSKINTLTGLVPTIGGYDGALLPDEGGFQLFFELPTQGAGEDVPRLQVLSTTGTMSAFVGVQQQGGPGGNQGNEVVTTGNHAPTVTAPADKTIPARTPFTLTGSGTDADGNPLTYLWEQNDVGGLAQGTSLVSNTKTAGPLFRVFGTYADVSQEESLQSPSPDQNLAGTSPSRTFPDLEQVLAGNTNAETGACPEAPADPAKVPVPTVECFAEFLPTADYGDPLLGSQLNFRLTGRDGHATGGGTSYDDVTLSVDTSAGPFQVTSRSTAGEPVKAGADEAVTWDVNGTDAAGLAPDVRISLSTDGGRTFPHVLKATTPNDGSETVTLPAVGATQARLKIEAVGNYFFDVSDADFTVVDPAAPDTTITGGLEPNSFVLTGNVDVGLASSETGATFRCLLDGTPLVCDDATAKLRNLTPGMHRFSVAARGASGKLDASPATRLFSVPVSAKALVRTRGWTGASDARAYRGFALTTRAKGAALTYDARRATRLALVVGTGPGFGRVRVFFEGKRVAQLSLASGARAYQVLLPLERFGRPKDGTLRIVALDGKPVRIEGLGVFSR